MVESYMQINDPSAWVEKAEEDYAIALLAIRRKRPFLYGACFHAQQTAEKYLKAALVSRKRSFPRVHDLIELSKNARVQAYFFSWMKTNSIHFPIMRYESVTQGHRSTSKTQNEQSPQPSSFAILSASCWD